MSAEEVVSEKKRALLAYKKKLLNECAVCDKRIEDVRRQTAHVYYDDDDSSDSDSGFPQLLSQAPSTATLMQEVASLKVCLQATMELTSLQVLESQVDVMVEPPKLNGVQNLPPGLNWREVTVECRIDLVPFSINFYVHKPDAKFSALSYHELRVTAVKIAHEKELSKSVLSGVKCPSDAIQIIRSYSLAHRSRRTSLARLAEKYPEVLFMESHPEGGYILKCAELLTIFWSLENKWSPIAPFYHRLKFDIEYIDESYLKSIKQAHKQLMDSSVETDERTNLLMKIIDTVLLANQGTVSSIHDSDIEPVSPEKSHNRTTLDQEPEMPIIKEKSKKNKDSEVMAPPKQLPKKMKAKAKENVNEKVSGKDVESKTGKVKESSGKHDSTKADKVNMKMDKPSAKNNNEKEETDKNTVKIDKQVEKTVKNNAKGDTQDGTVAKQDERSNKKSAVDKTSAILKNSTKNDKLSSKVDDPNAEYKKQGTKDNKRKAEDKNEPNKKARNDGETVTSKKSNKDSENTKPNNQLKDLQKTHTQNGVERKINKNFNKKNDVVNENKIKSTQSKIIDSKVKTQDQNQNKVKKTKTIENKNQEKNINEKPLEKEAKKDINTNKELKTNKTQNKVTKEILKETKSTEPTKKPSIKPTEKIISGNKGPEIANKVKELRKSLKENRQISTDKNVNKVIPNVGEKISITTKIPVLKSKVLTKGAMHNHGITKKFANPVTTLPRKSPTGSIYTQKVAMGIRNSPRLLKKTSTPKPFFGI